MKTPNVHLVLTSTLVEGRLFVDSAWSTAEAANARVRDLAASIHAFSTHLPHLTTIEIRVDVGGSEIEMAARELVEAWEVNSRALVAGGKDIDVSTGRLERAAERLRTAVDGANSQAEGEGH